MASARRGTMIATVVAIAAAAAVASTALPAGGSTARDGATGATAVQAGGRVGDWVQNSASSTPLDTRSFVDILGSITQAGTSAPHAITVRAVARVVARTGSTTRGTIDVICELIERPANHVADRVQVTVSPRGRSTLLNTAVAILAPGFKVQWRCRQQHTSPTHFVRLEHARLVDLVVGDGRKLGFDD